MPDRSSLSFAQVQSAMKAMIDKAMQTPEEPVAMAIVDDTGNLVAYIKMDNLRLFSRRHALRKAYTAAIVGMDTGAHAQRLHSQGTHVD
jgi:glc operon protein GlcG